MADVDLVLVSAQFINRINVTASKEFGHMKVRKDTNQKRQKRTG